MPPVLLVTLIFVVALVYASVGHGGASGYLAALSLLAYEPAAMATSALLLNLVVAGMAYVAFAGAGYASPRLMWPFIVVSVPAAFLGSQIPVAPQVYGWLLAAVFLVTAWRLCLPLSVVAQGLTRTGPRLSVTLPVGSGLGLVSGIVGIGGGVFLSPLMILRRWADPKRAAAVAAGFIVVNSAAGLAGRVLAGRFESSAFWPLVVAAAIGGWIGSRLGAHHLPNVWLCRLLAVVLGIAAIKGMVVG